jgi:hypothetical protein
MGNRAIGYIMILILFLSVISISNNVSAVTATIVAKFDQENLEYTYGPDDSNTLIVSGNLTCEVEGLIEGYQYLKVYLYAGENNGWDPAVSPSVTNFHESGTQEFKASILIPHYADNRTEVKLVVSGNWYVQPQGEKLPDSSGSVYSDKINITIIRIEPPFIEEMSEGGSHGSDPGIHPFGFPYVLLTVVLPIICAVLISYFFIKRRKRKILSND